MSNIVFTNIKSPSQDAKLEKDAEGYYNICLGAFNYPNSIGEAYPFTQEVKALFDKSSSFMKKIQNGQLYAELDHPAMEPGMTPQQYIARISKIDMDNVAAHIREIELVPSKTKMNNGSPVVYAYGWVKPFGTHKQMLQDSLDTQSINTAFSLRCLFKYGVYNGVRSRLIFSIINYDFVVSPGLPQASKYSTQTGLESNVEFTTEELKEAINGIEEEYKDNQIGLEAEYPMLNDIKSALCSDDSRCIYNTI